jgi:hypothetical protein
MPLSGSRLTDAVRQRRTPLLRPRRLPSLPCLPPEQVRPKRRREPVLLSRWVGVRQLEDARFGRRALGHRDDDARPRPRGQANATRWISERRCAQELQPPRASPRIPAPDPGGAAATPRPRPDSIRPAKDWPLSLPGRRRGRQAQLRPHREPGYTRRARASLRLQSASPNSSRPGRLDTQSWHGYWSHACPPARRGAGPATTNAGAFGEFRLGASAGVPRDLRGCVLSQGTGTRGDRSVASPDRPQRRGDPGQLAIPVSMRYVVPPVLTGALLDERLLP